MEQRAFLVGGVGVESGEEKKAQRDRYVGVTRREGPFYKFFVCLSFGLSLLVFFPWG